MAIRNELLGQILVAYGGTHIVNDTRNTILQKILVQLGGSSDSESRNELLTSILGQI